VNFGRNQYQGRKGGWLLLLLPAVLCLPSGCARGQWNLLKKGGAEPAGPADSLVMRGDQVETPASAPINADLAAAHAEYRQGAYKTAERLYHKIADNTKNPVLIAEEARYYEAECLRLQERYPKAADTYARLLLDFPSGTHRDLACQRMFDIADGWLEDTRQEMEQFQEKKEGKRWIVWPSLVHLEKTKPLIDEEGRAEEKLEQVVYNDITGPLADKALWLLGSVKFYREAFKEADEYFSQLVDRHPNSPLAPKALELAIISKNLSTGGSDYDCRKVLEARMLIDNALKNYPTLAAQKEDFLHRQLINISKQQAEKDFKIAEFYQRTGHPGSAYFYYEIVRRRYPGVQPYFDKATERMHELRAKLEKEGDRSAPKVPDPNEEKPSGFLEKLMPGKPVAPSEQAPPPRSLPPEFSGRP
jgi:outer membrane protein assembly factor BamD (BamD/ComL family)